MSEDKFDVIIVGGGLAGSTAAYLLAKAGLEVIVIERGDYCGSKNVTGGRIYGHSLEKIIPGFASRAPVERKITKERISMMTQDGVTTVEYGSDALGEKGAASYSVLRAKFDQWLAEEAEAQGAMYICGIRVDELIVRAGKVCGVKAGDEEMEADVVILADGVNSLLAQQIRMKKELEPGQVAVGAKEIITLGEEKLRDRFGLEGENGLGWMFVGAPTAGNLGGGFLYTNKDSVSLGIVTTVGDIGYSGVSVVQMLDNFKRHPAIRPLIEGGSLAEYAAHLVPEGGYDMIPELYRDGVLVVGDAAGLVINLGYMTRGMDLAVESARRAAETVLYAKRKGDFSRKTLAAYKVALEESFVMKDLKQHKNAPHFMENRRLFGKYPMLVDEILRSLFMVDGTPSAGILSKVTPALQRVSLTELGNDGMKALQSL